MGGVGKTVLEGMGGVGKTVLEGMGGVGKTALAAEAVARLAGSADFPAARFESRWLG